MSKPDKSKLPIRRTGPVTRSATGVRATAQEASDAINRVVTTQLSEASSQPNTAGIPPDSDSATEPLSSIQNSSSTTSDNPAAAVKKELREDASVSDASGVAADKGRQFPQSKLPRPTSVSPPSRTLSESTSRTHAAHRGTPPGLGGIPEEPRRALSDIDDMYAEAGGTPATTGGRTKRVEPPRVDRERPPHQNSPGLQPGSLRSQRDAVTRTPTASEPPRRRVEEGRRPLMPIADIDTVEPANRPLPDSQDDGNSSSSDEDTSRPTRNSSSTESAGDEEPLDDLMQTAYRELYGVAEESEQRFAQWQETMSMQRRATMTRLEKLELTLGNLADRASRREQRSSHRDRARSVSGVLQQRNRTGTSNGRDEVPVPRPIHSAARETSTTDPVNQRIPDAGQRRPMAKTQAERLHAAGLNGPRATAVAAPGGPGDSDSDTSSDNEKGRGNDPGPPSPPPRRRPARPPSPEDALRRPASGVNPRFLREQHLPSASQGIGLTRTLTQRDAAVAYAESAYQWISDCIDEAVGRSLEILPQIKSVKVSQPKSYLGQDDTDEFEEWLLTVLRWLRVTRITGPELDVERVQLLGLILSGAALDWYNQEVASPYRQIRHWRFEDAVCALYRRFIHQATAQTATEKFEAVRFDNKTGTAAYFGELRKFATRMVAHPDPYTFRRRFLNGLPRSIVMELTRGRGLSAENSSIDELLHEAIAIENAIQYLEAYDRVSRTNTTRTVTTGTSLSASSGTTGAPGGQRRMTPRLRMRTGGRPGTVSSMTGPPTRTNPSTAYRSQAGPSIQSSGRPAPNGRLPSVSRGPNLDKGKQIDMSKIMCYACNGVGHYASDPACPKYTGGRAALHRITEDGDQTESPDQEMAGTDAVPSMALGRPDEEEGPLDGSQYEPAEDYALDTYEDYEYDAEYFEDIEDESPAQFRSMRVVPDDNGDRRTIFHWVDDELEFVEGPAELDPPLDPNRDWELHHELDPFNPDLTAETLDEAYNSLPPPHFIELVRRTLRRAADRSRSPSHSLATPLAPAHRHQMNAWLTQGVARRLADSYAMNPDRDPITQLDIDLDAEGGPVWAAEHGWQQLNSVEDMISRLLQEGAELRTEVRTLVTGIDRGISMHELRQLGDNVLARDRMRTQDWIDFITMDEDNGYLPNDEPELTRSTVLDDMDYVEQLIHSQAHPEYGDTEVDTRSSTPDDGVLGTHMPSFVAFDDLAAALGTLTPPLGATQMLDPAFDGDGSDHASMPSLTTASVTGQSASDDEERSDDGNVDDDDNMDTPRPPARFNAMTVQLHAVTDEKRAYRTAMHTNGNVEDRPRQKGRCMTVYCVVNGLRAKALLDSGSTINCISPEFVNVSKVEVFALSEPMGLQLGCVGSRSRINYGVRAAVELDNEPRDLYLDVVNLDHYDVILGVPYMRLMGMRLDFASNTIQFGNHSMAVIKREDKEPARKAPAPKVRFATRPLGSANSQHQ